MLLQNPYQFSAVITAKVAVNVASLIWSTIVIYKENALASTFIYYGNITRFLSEDIFASILLAISLIQLIRLVFRSKPIMIGGIGYAILTLFWMYIWWNIIVSIGPIQPASFSAVTVLVALSIYAFVANPRKPC